MGYPVMARPGLVASMVALVVAGWLVGPAAGQEQEKKVFMVRDYRYEPPEGWTGNQDIALSLCGTRCNAISGDFASYLKPGGWRMLRVASDVVLKIDISNPFLAGQCVCLGDEYKIQWYDPATYIDRADVPPPAAP